MTDLSKGLVCHIPLDKTSLHKNSFGDSTPYCNHGVYTDTPDFVADRMGQPNRATNFGSIDAAVNCGHNEILNFDDDKLTMSIWVKPRNHSDASIVWKSNNGIGDYWGCYGFAVHDQKFRWLASDVCDSPNTIILDKWVHLLGIFDSENLSLYENNVLVHTIQSNYYIGTSDQDLMIGVRKYDHVLQYPFNAAIAELRIYNRAVSPKTRTAIHELYRPKLKISSLQKDLVLDMPLNERWQ